MAEDGELLLISKVGILSPYQEHSLGKADIFVCAH